MFAIFIQGSAVGSYKAQVLITPPTHSGPSEVFYRVAIPGARGSSARWERLGGDPERVMKTIPSALNDALDFDPVAVKFTASDDRQMTERGVPTTLGTKAIAACPTHPAPTGKVLRDVLFDLMRMVREQDPQLVTYFRDRRTSFIEQPKVIATPPVLVMPDVVTPTVGEQPTQVLVESTPTMRMASVPARDIADRYVHRQVYGADDFAIFEYAQQTKANILVKGPTGAAKTMSALAYAASKGLPTFTISGSVNFEVSEAIGQLMINPDGSMYFQHGGAVEVIRDGGVLILDEINFIPGKVITPLFPLLDDRREIVLKQNKGEVIKAHPDLLIIATMNPGYLGTQQLNAALANRFDIQLDWEYDDNVEKQLVPSKALRELAKQLREAEAGKRIFTPTPTNAIMEIVSLSKALGIDFAISNFLARYDESERASVNLFLETHRANIEQDLGFATAVSIETDEVAAPAVTETEWERQLLDQGTPATVNAYSPAGSSTVERITLANNNNNNNNPF